jgi:hypothetical protein
MKFPPKKKKKKKGSEYQQIHKKKKSAYIGISGLCFVGLYKENGCKDRKNENGNRPNTEHTHFTLSR